MQPEPGLYLDVEFVRARDVDTIEWRIPNHPWIWVSRLIGVWGPELNKGTDESKIIAREGKKFVEQICLSCDKLNVFIPIPKGTNLFKNLSFDRIPSFVYAGSDVPLNTIVVSHGFASSTKTGKLGE